MIRVYARLILLLSLGCVLAISLARLRGESLPDRAPWIDIGFSACALPCWANIRVGQTPFDLNQLIPALANILPAEQTRMLLSGSQINLWVDDGEQELMSGFIYYSGGVIGDMRLNIAQPVGQLVRRLGTPDCTWIEQADSTLRLVLYWEREGVSSGAMIDLGAHQRLAPETMTISLWMSATSSACDRAQARPWLGFANRLRYIAASQHDS